MGWEALSSSWYPFNGYTGGSWSVKSLTSFVIFFAASLGSLTMHRHTQKRSVETRIIAIVIKLPNIMSIFAV